MNDIFLTLGLESWKPLLTALAMPPVPFLVLVLLGTGARCWAGCSSSCR